MEEASKSVVDLINSLLPGFLAAWVFYGLTAHPKTEKFERVVQALIFTALIQGLTVLVEWVLLAIGHVFSVGQWTQNCALVWSLVLGVLLGLIFARFANTNCLHHWLWQWPLYDRVRQHRGMRWLPAWGWTSRTSYPSEWFSAFTQEKRQVVLHLSGGRRLSDFIAHATEALKLPTPQQMAERIGLVKSPATQPARPVVQAKPSEGEQRTPQEGQYAPYAARVAIATDPRVGMVRPDHLQTFRDILNQPARPDEVRPDAYVFGDYKGQALGWQPAVNYLGRLRSNPDYLALITGKDATRTISFRAGNGREDARFIRGASATQVQEAEIGMADKARADLAARTRYIDAQQIGPKFAALVDRVQAQGGQATVSQKRTLITYGNIIMEYATLRQQVGYTVDEVKEMMGHRETANAPYEVPMFANELEMERRGREAAAALGIRNQTDFNRFIAAQGTMIRQRLNATRQSYGTADQPSPILN